MKKYIFILIAAISSANAASSVDSACDNIEIFNNRTSNIYLSNNSQDSHSVCTMPILIRPYEIGIISIRHSIIKDKIKTEFPVYIHFANQLPNTSYNFFAEFEVDEHHKYTERTQILNKDSAFSWSNDDSAYALCSSEDFVKKGGKCW